MLIRACCSPLTDASRQHIFDAWKDDFNRLKRLAEASRPSPKEVKAWHVYGKAKFFVKRLKFPPTSSLKFIGPVSDILGIVVSGIGLYDAIKNQNTMGIVNSVLGIVGSVVALSLFTTALVTGIQVQQTGIRCTPHGLTSLLRTVHLVRRSSHKFTYSQTSLIAVLRARP